MLICTHRRKRRPAERAAATASQTDPAAKQVQSAKTAGTHHAAGTGDKPISPFSKRHSCALPQASPHLFNREDCAMTAHKLRGVIAAFASPQGGTTPAPAVAELSQAFVGFREEFTGELAGLQTAIDELNQAQAALRLSPGNAEQHLERRQAMTAVASFMRSGSVAAMQALTAQASMSTDNDPNGGYTVPTEVDRVIQSQLVEMSPMRGLASIVSTRSSDYKKMVNRRGASSGWVGERESRPATDSPVLAQIAPPIGEIYAEPEITQTLLDDSSFDLAGFLQENVSDEFSVQEGTAFISGDGVNKPRGLLTYPTAETADASRDFGTLQFVKTGVAAALADSSNNGIDKLIDLVASVKPAYRAGPGVGWQMNSTTAAVLRKLKSLGDTANYLWQESNVEGMPPRLLGYPVFENEYFSDIGANAFPIAFGNWRRGYVIVDRSELRLLRDPLTNKPYVRFYFTKRVGGAVTDSNAIKLLKVAA